MSDILCSYDDREAVLMAYLYDEIGPSARDAFEEHLTTCARCRVELNGLSGVRAQLADWAPPDYRSHNSPATGRDSVAGRESLLAVPGLVMRRAADKTQRPARDEQRARWRDIPAWAQIAAAMVVLGISAGAANLSIHYDSQNGLTIRTGWSNSNQQGSHVSQRSQETASADVVSHGELMALEQKLRGELQAVSAPASARPVSNAADADTMRRVRALLDETERRHERELALRVAEVVRDLNAQRQADLVKIDQNLNQGRVEVLRNRQMLDYYMQRVSRPQ